MKEREIFIDGASLYHASKELGVSQIDYGALRDSLCGLGNRGKPVKRRWITLHPGYRDSRTEKMIRAAGFRIIWVTTDNSDDDKELITRINSVDYRRISEIIVVSSDMDFLPALYAVADKISVVYLVAPRFLLGRNGKPVMGELLRREIEAGHPKICIVDLESLQFGKREARESRLPNMEITIKVYESDPRVLQDLQIGIERLKPLVEIEVAYKKN